MRVYFSRKESNAVPEKQNAFLRRIKINAPNLQYPVQRVGLSSAFHFQAALYYNKSTAKAIRTMLLRKSLQAEAKGVSVFATENMRNSGAFQGTGRNQAEKQVSESST